MSPKANNSTASGNSSTGKRFYTDIANKTNYIYVTPDITAPYRVYRFAITDITTPTVYNHISITNSYQMALDPSRDLGSVVAQNNQCVEIFDLLTMSFVTTFNYTRGKYPWFDSSVPGGWGIAIDSKRGLLYVAVDCDTPTPGIIWQYNVANLSRIAYIDNTVWGSAPCFNLGFVEVADGRAWFYEDDAGWIGGFDMTDLSWGSSYSVATVNYLRSLEYDASLHTAYFLDHGSTGVPTYTGQVFRGCLLDPGNIIHEAVPWQKYGRTDDLCGSYLDTAQGVLYAVRLQCRRVHHLHSQWYRLSSDSSGRACVSLFRSHTRESSWCAVRVILGPTGKRIHESHSNAQNFL